MKYLKYIREGFNNYYVKIREVEYDPAYTYDKKPLNGYIPFERRYYTKLVEMGFDYSDDTVLGCCSGYFNKLNFYIYQREDDYFDVEVGVLGKREYFRCDQFEGLMELLKDKGVILR